MKWKVRNIKGKYYLIAVFLFVIIDIVLFYILVNPKVLPSVLTSQNINSNNNLDQDIADFKKHNLTTYKEVSDYFSNFAKAHGAVEAFELLKVAPLPPSMDTHLLGHVVGDELYKQQGAKGIEYCTQDFRNACSHSIVIGLLIEKGPEAFSEIVDACKLAPGGRGAYDMCFHGLGHGVVTYTGYNLEDAVTMCKKTGTEKDSYHEESQCISGAIMELISGGDHNRILWNEAIKKYFKESDPLYPCDDNIIPERDKPLCYVYLSPHLFEAGGANPGSRPTDDNFTKAFQFCNKIPLSQVENRAACFGGFGKEFVVLAQDHDIRNISLMDEKAMQTTISWCKLAGIEVGISKCLNTALESIYWGGENDYHAAIHFCSVIVESDLKDQCFSELFSSVNYYVSNFSNKRTFCQAIPTEYSDKCSLDLHLK